MKYYILIIFFLPIYMTSQSSIEFSPIWNGQSMEWDEDGMSTIHDSFQFSNFKFFIGNIGLKRQGNIVWQDSQYYLIDATQPDGMFIKNAWPSLTKFDQIIFTIGVDSIDNERLRYDGPLDPARGMYWAWNSGYINVKIEGTHPKCTTRKNQFNYHLGGYLSPFESNRIVTFDTNQNIIHIAVDLKKFMENADILLTPNVMSPSDNAAQLSTHFVKSFSLK